ncbi:MAG: hypothetical protein JST54_12550 [Deltaproteobacteria bacterium]|nr:hypothetical protein [Deltaproteobacteria bacterium]
MAEATSGNTQGNAGSNADTTGTSATSTSNTAALTGAPETTTDAKTTGQAAGANASEKKTDAKTDADAAKAATSALADSFEFKLPEGIEKTDPALGGLRELAKAQGLNEKQAQAVADAYFKSTETARQAAAAQVAEQKSWADAIKNDKELGGPHFDESVKFARIAVEKLGGTDLRKALAGLGLGDHPALFRAFARAGRVLAEDSIAGTQRANGAAKGERTPLEAMAGLYTNPNPQA